MKRILIATGVLLCVATAAHAQSLADLNLQVHGYATQGFLYTTNNNILTTSSSDGSPAWTEAVLNISTQPTPKLHVSVQGRYFLLGDFGDTITLDYAMADYKVNDRFGVRFGKVKTPSGLLNEVQDIDPSYMWSLLPQSNYPISSRNSFLSHYGGVVYGMVNLGEKLGRLEYRGWGGERSIEANDGYFLSGRELGLVFPNGLDGIIFGTTLRWRTPLPGLMIGASLSHSNQTTSAMTDTIQGFGTFNGTATVNAADQPQYFARFERQKLMVAGEFYRSPANAAAEFPGVFAEKERLDLRGWYGMASYKLTDKLTAGIYHSQLFDHQAALGPARYQKDWAISSRYDFNEYLYAKAEQHFLDGTATGYDTALNPGGLKPASRLTILKLGVRF